VVNISVVSLQTSRRSSAYQANTNSTFKLSTTMLLIFLAIKSFYSALRAVSNGTASFS